MGLNYWRPNPNLNGHIFSYGRTDAGKCLAKGTKVFMADGSLKNIEDIKIGDEILSPTKDFKKNNVAKVGDTFSHFDKEIYEVVLNRNKKEEVLYTCNGEHQIPLHDGRLFLAKNIKGRKYTMLSPQIDWGKKECEINAYLLGVFLGDGTFTYTNFSFSFSKKKSEILNYFKKIYPGELTSSNWENLCHILSKKGKFAKCLKDLGLYEHTSKNKFIPKEALFSSIKFRKRLLAGLLDTDGYLENKGKNKTFEYLTKSKKLSEDINFLVRSLGGYCYLRKCKKGNSKNKMFDYYRLSIYVGFNLPLKTKRMKKFTPRFKKDRKIPIFVRKTKPQEVYGISVLSESELYIVNNFIITHNTWKLTAIVQYYHAKKYKIWDLWGGKRKEGGFWCFPSDEHKLWFDYEKKVGEMTAPGPKQYKVNLMYPFFSTQMPDELPENKPFITSKPFTIFFKEIGNDEISTITGAITMKAQNVWKKIKKELPDKANGEDILAWFEKGSNTQYKRYNIYESFILPFCENKILQGRDCVYNIDLKSESRDKEAITVLMDEYTPEEFKMFFIIYIMKRVYEMGEKDLISRRNLGFFRELNYFMKVQDESAQDAEQKQIMRNAFSNIARYGRSSFLIAGDTQSPSEVKGLVEGQDDMLLLNEMPSPTDREKTCDHLIRDGRMSPAQRDYLGSIEMGQDEEKKPGYKGKLVVVERGKRARLISRVQPPRTKCFKVSDGNFEKVWKKLINKYLNLKDIKTNINDFYLLRKDKMQKEKEFEKQEEEIFEDNSIKNITSDIEEPKIDKSDKERLLELKKAELEKLMNSEVMA